MDVPVFPACGKPGWEDPYLREVRVGDPCPWVEYGGEIPGHPHLGELGVGDPWGSLPGGRQVGDPQEQVRNCSMREHGGGGIPAGGESGWVIPGIPVWGSLGG